MFVRVVLFRVCGDHRDGLRDAWAAAPRQEGVVAFLLYGQTRQSPRWERFRARWPTVAETVEQLKVGDYRNAAWTLQRAESTVMILGVCGLIHRENPEIPLLTIMMLSWRRQR